MWDSSRPLSAASRQSLEPYSYYSTAPKQSPLRYGTTQFTFQVRTAYYGLLEAPLISSQSAQRHNSPQLLNF